MPNQSKVYVGFGSSQDSGVVYRGTAAVPAAPKFVWHVRGIQAPSNGFADIRSVFAAQQQTNYAPPTATNMIGRLVIVSLTSASPGHIVEQWDDFFGEPATRPDISGRITGLMNIPIQGNGVQTRLRFAAGEIRARDSSILYVAAGYFFDAGSATGFAIDSSIGLGVNGLYGTPNDDINIRYR